jgi:murein DD-endopeptidase MepM/ murein hydrolase activator NlpD
VAAVVSSADQPVRADSFILPRVARQGLAMVALAPQRTVRLTVGGIGVPVAPDGRFLLALDRDAPGAVRLLAERDGADPVEATLTIAPGDWRIEHVNTPWRGSAATDADFARRRAAELDQINTARRTAVSSDGWRQSFIWPVRGRLSGLFGSQRVYQGKPGSYHGGLDIAVPTGTPFVAPADGVVVLAATQPFTLEGNLLIVDHGMGLSSAFLHAARLDVAVGQAVRQGQPLGTVGATGRATGPHLHWGLRWRSARLDPLPLLP